MRFPYWLRLQFSLRTLFVATASVAAAFSMFQTGHRELALLTAIPLGEGFAVGDMVPKRRRYDVHAFLKAIAIFPLMVWVVLWIWATIEALVYPHFQAPAALHGFWAATLFLPEMLMFGAPAGIAGLTIGHVLRNVDAPMVRDPVA